MMRAGTPSTTWMIPERPGPPDIAKTRCTEAQREDAKTPHPPNIAAAPSAAAPSTATL
jgi:hypothetical protein